MARNGCGQAWPSPSPPYAQSGFKWLISIFKRYELTVASFSATLYFSNHSNLRKLEFLNTVSPLLKQFWDPIL